LAFFKRYSRGIQISNKQLLFITAPLSTGEFKIAQEFLYLQKAYLLNEALAFPFNNSFNLAESVLVIRNNTIFVYHTFVITRLI